MIAESEKSYPTGMWAIFYRKLDEPTVWKKHSLQSSGVIEANANGNYLKGKL